MEKDLKMYMTEEFIKLNTAEEQREFIENLRFLMMEDDKDFLIWELENRSSIPCLTGFIS